MKNYLQDLTEEHIEKLCYDLKLGSFDYAELIAPSNGEIYFNLSVTDAPPKGIDLTYSFSNHGLVNSGFGGQFVCDHFDEFEMVEKNPATIHINQFFMAFMEKNFKGYLESEIKNRQEKIDCLVSVIKQNTEVIDKLQEHLTKQVMLLHKLEDGQFDEMTKKVSSLGNGIAVLESNVMNQYKEATYHDTMMRIGLQIMGKDPNEPKKIDEYFPDDFDIEFYRPDEKMIEVSDDENEDEDTDALDFEANPDLENYLPDYPDIEDSDENERY